MVSLSPSLDTKRTNVVDGSNDTIGEYILQKVLDTSPITTTGFCCHKISLAKVGYSRDMCPKQPKKVSHYVKILEKNCLKIKFFK